MERCTCGDIGICFVGSVVPPDQSSSFAAYSEAGNRFQMGVVKALCGNSTRPCVVISGRPVPSYPQVRRLLFWRCAGSIEGIPTVYLPFVNLGPLKTLSLSLASMATLTVWGWRHRHCRHRVVVMYNTNSPHGLPVLAAARLTGTRVVAWMMDMMVPGHGIGSSWLRKLDFRLQAWALRHMDGLVVSTRQIADDFAPRVPCIQMDGTIAEEVADLLQSVPPTVPDRDNVSTILYAGTLDETRGIDLLLRAFQLLEGSGYRLVVTGRGPLESQVIEASHRDSRIQYLGFLTSYEDVLKLYGSASVVVSLYMPTVESTKYLFPSKLLECLMSGRPVIASPSPGVREEYGGLVLMLEDETPAALARLLIQACAMGPDERRRRAQTQQAYIMRNKTWRTYGPRIVDFVRSIAIGAASVRN